MIPRRLSAVVLAFVIVALVGCSNSSSGGRVEVSGTVKLKDQPLKTGIVMFEPLDGQDTAVNATLTDGEYAVAREFGLKPGKYLIRVTAGDGKTPVNPLDPEAGPGPTGGTNIVSKDLVPADWNVNSKQEVTVTKDGPNKFDFDIK
jgi:hypothetical protein